MTDDSATGLERLIAAAQAGDRDALNQLLDRHKDWLRLIAAGKLRRDVRARVGDSDLVNETLLSAFKGFAKFKGNKTVEFQVWLKRIFDRNLHDTIRFHVDAVRRSVDMEHTHLADEPLDFSDDDISPSEAVLLGEDAMLLAEALESLPEDQRIAVRMRHLEELSLDEIEQQLGRSREACAGLIKRGVEALRKRLPRQ